MIRKSLLAHDCAEFEVSLDPSSVIKACFVRRRPNQVEVDLAPAKTLTAIPVHGYCFDSFENNLSSRPRRLARIRHARKPGKSTVSESCNPHQGQKNVRSLYVYQRICFLVEWS